MSSIPGSPLRQPTEPYGPSSPTSTLSGSPSLSTSVHSLTQEASRTSLRGMFTGSNPSTGKKPVIRADPAMRTCFDPKDKELYNLWAPSQ
ncbi:hypothetical protein BDP27DRAFT_1314390, partial [Rhodocollybia butyracea]